jgi:GMP synthase-like glutamine amidotransferase
VVPGKAAVGCAARRSLTAARATVRVGLVICEDAAAWNDLTEVWRAALGSRFELVPFLAFAGELPQREQLEPGSGGALDALLVSGSHYSVVASPEARAWVQRVGSLVRFAAGIEALDGPVRQGGQRARVLGVCFGCQLVAHALGGKVGPVGSQHRPVFGAEEVRPSAAAPQMPFWEPISRPMRLLQAHGEQVTQLPPRAVRLAGSDSCVNEVFVVPAPPSGPGADVLAVQAHPEMTVRLMKERVVNEFPSMPPQRADRGLASLQAPHDSARMLAIVRAFLARSSHPEAPVAQRRP